MDKLAQFARTVFSVWALGRRPVACLVPGKTPGLHVSLFAIDGVPRGRSGELHFKDVEVPSNHLVANLVSPYHTSQL